MEREHAYFVWDEVLPSRFNHPERNAQVLAAQRTHVADLHAHVIESHDYTTGGGTTTSSPACSRATNGRRLRRDGARRAKSTGPSGSRPRA